MRRHLYGGARKSGACSVGWNESSSPKGFAEAFAHVKGYSCCCFVAAASHMGAGSFGYCRSFCRFRYRRRRCLPNQKDTKGNKIARRRHRLFHRASRASPIFRSPSVTKQSASHCRTSIATVTCEEDVKQGR